MSQMDEESLLNRYENLLNSRLKHLENQEKMNVGARDTVVLDQQSVGRLSRMDAMQQQAMANATANNRAQEIAAIYAALARIAAKEYGYCDVCGEDILPKRLEISPTAMRCVACATS